MFRYFRNVKLKVNFSFLNASKIFRLLPAGIFFMAGLFSANAADWYRWRGPDLNGISKEKNWQTEWPSEGPKKLWKASVGIGFSSFAVSNGRVYTMGNASDTDAVFCFDANTGKEIWRHSYPAPLDPQYYEGGTSATPAVDDNRVYTISKRG